MGKENEAYADVLTLDRQVISTKRRSLADW